MFNAKLEDVQIRDKERSLFIGDRFLNYHISKHLASRFGGKAASRLMTVVVANKNYASYVSESLGIEGNYNQLADGVELFAGLVEEFYPNEAPMVVSSLAADIISFTDLEISEDKDDKFSAMLAAKKAESELRAVHINHKGRALERIVNTGITISTSHTHTGLGFRCQLKVMNDGLSAEFVGVGGTKKDAEQLAYEKINSMLDLDQVPFIAVRKFCSFQSPKVIV
jgi:dsRNA-specific ribonuclease